LSNSKLDVSNNHLEKIKVASSHSAKFQKSFEEILKNEGIADIFMDPSKTHLQLIHHGQVLGGNWSSYTKGLVAVLGVDSQAKPVQAFKD
jgi:hypothetical protein